MAHSVPIKKKGCRDCHFQAKSDQTNSHRRQERGPRNSGEKLQSNEAHWGAWLEDRWGGAIKQENKVSYITF